MTKRRFVLVASILMLVAFIVGAKLYDANRTHATPAIAGAGNELVRPHSPFFGPAEAPVTIVEFFDPSCEACRAYYPAVKKILATFPKDVRLVLRYAAFHQFSDEAVRILEVARLQGKFEPVLEALLERQPIWAAHNSPDMAKAWDFARMAGLDVARGQSDKSSAAIARVLEQDMSDAKSADIRQTPTFFVNGKPLINFGVQQLLDLVRSEVQNSRQASK